MLVAVVVVVLFLLYYGWNKNTMQVNYEVKVAVKI